MRRKQGTWLLAMLLAWRIMIPAQDALPVKPPPPQKTPLRKALERSLLFPGLGQLGEKQYVKAALFGGAEIACLVQVLILIGKGNHAYHDYGNATDPLAVTTARALTEKYDRQRNTAILAAAGVWVLNMIDILVFAKKKYGKKSSIAFQPYYNHENKKLGADLRFLF